MLLLVLEGEVSLMLGWAASLLGVVLIAVLGSALVLTVVVREVACGVGVGVEFG